MLAMQQLAFQCLAVKSRLATLFPSWLYRYRIRRSWCLHLILLYSILLLLLSMIDQSVSRRLSIPRHLHPLTDLTTRKSPPGEGRVSLLVSKEASPASGQILNHKSSLAFLKTSSGSLWPVLLGKWKRAQSFKDKSGFFSRSPSVRIHHKRDIHEPQEEMTTQPTDCFLDVECSPGGMLNETIVICVQGKCQLITSNNSTDDAQGSTKRKGTSAAANSRRMLPIMIIMGVMFVGMCVAMNMFSRARFKNNRSIFSNPRILKVANANQQSGKRRKSRRRNLLDEHRKHTAALAGDLGKVADSVSSVVSEEEEKEEEGATEGDKTGTPKETLSPQSSSNQTDLSTVYVVTSTEEISL